MPNKGGKLNRWLLIFLPFIFSFSTCGHRGAPLPPLTKKPAPPEITYEVQDYNRPLIVWKRVSTYEDGRRLPDPSKVLYEVLIDFGKRRVRTRNNYLLDVPIGRGEKRCYKVISIYGREKNEGSVKCMRGGAPIEEVPKVKLTSGDGFVRIDVENPLMEVEVFRNQRFPFIKPYAKFKGSSFLDKKVKNGTKYEYRFRFSKGPLKGRLTAPLFAVPEDRIPPLPPQSAYMVKYPTCVIFWEPSPSSDVVGYLLKFKNGEVKVDGIYFVINGSCPKSVTIYAVDKAKNRSKPVVPEVIDEESGSSNGK